MKFTMLYHVRKLKSYVLPKKTFYESVLNQNNT